MKLTVVLLIVILLVPSLFLAACGPTLEPDTTDLGPIGPGGIPPEATIRISCDDFGSQPHRSEQVNVHTGSKFMVLLCSNPTTGFKWSESAQISDPTVVQQRNHEFFSAETSGNVGMVGAPGSDVWSFNALKKGTSTITLEYGRPWEGGEKGEWTLNLTVVVE